MDILLAVILIWFGPALLVLTVAPVVFIYLFIKELIGTLTTEEI
jgi:hypothetical protein